MTERIGQQLGNYRLTKLLGRGGFAEVYLGEHIYLKTPAAIKLLQAHLSSPDDRESFLQEARTVARLIHPHIVRVTDFGVDAEIPYLVMDYAPNGTLRQRHPKGSRLPLSTILTYVKQIAAGLQYAHDEKLVHRDIKPENMLIGRNNDIVISDFGIALTAQSSRHQSTQDVVGTVAYMSPEQIQGKPRLASDQYSLAIVVYEWLSGSLPFQGSFTELCTQHMFATPPPLHEKMPTITPEIEHVINIALSKDPKQRFGSIQAFANALEQASQANAPTAVAEHPALTNSTTPAAGKAQEGSGEIPRISAKQQEISASGKIPGVPPMQSATPANSGGISNVPPTTLATPSTNSSGPMRVTPSKISSGQITPSSHTTGEAQRNSAPVNSGAIPSQPALPMYPPPPPQMAPYPYPYAYPGYPPPYGYPPKTKKQGLWSFGTKQLIATIVGILLINLGNHVYISISTIDSMYGILPYFLLFLFFSSAFGPWVGLLTGALANSCDLLVHYPTWELDHGHWITYISNPTPVGYVALYGLSGFIIGLTGFSIFYAQAGLGKPVAAFLADLIGSIFLVIIAFAEFFIDNPTIASSSASEVSLTVQNYVSFFMPNIVFCAIAFFILLLIYSIFLPSNRRPAPTAYYPPPMRY